MSLFPSAISFLSLPSVPGEKTLQEEANEEENEDEEEEKQGEEAGE